RAIVVRRKEDSRSEWIEQNLLWVKTVARCGVAPSFHTVCIERGTLNGGGPDPAMPDSPRLVGSWVQPFFKDRLCLIQIVIQQECDTGRPPRVEREIPRFQAGHPRHSHGSGRALLPVPFVKTCARPQRFRHGLFVKQRNHGRRVVTRRGGRCSAERQLTGYRERTARR